MMTPTPHDALFRALVADPGRAQALLRDHLPVGIAKRLADKPPKIVEGTFVDETLRGSQSDLLMEVETKSGNPAFVHVLVEHKSAPDPGVALQLAGYMIRIWKRHARGRASRLRALLPIIPMVFHSGTDRWHVPAGLAEMIDGDDPELVVLPGERYILRQLAEMPPEALSRNPQLQAGLVTLTKRAITFLRLVMEEPGPHVALQTESGSHGHTLSGVALHFGTGNLRGR